VYLSPFEYHAPASLDEAVALLDARYPDAKALAGGQSLLPLMALGLARPAALVDLGRIPGLDGITQDDRGLCIGALVRHRVLETSDVVRARSPLLFEAASLIGNIRVRNRGTIGGSLAHADPAAELPMVITALRGTIEITGPKGRREVAAEDFFEGYLQTALQPGEIVTGVRVPPATGIIARGPALVAASPAGAGAQSARASSGYGLAELARRAGDFALVAACAVLDLDPDGRCAHVALVVAGAGPRPQRVRAVESLMAGAVVNEDLVREASERVPAEIEPESDAHASAEYRRAMAHVMARRALEAAVARARGTPGT
jgi:carbon-monoxide dehydrogenase medium subunit